MIVAGKTGAAAVASPYVIGAGTDVRLARVLIICRGGTPP
jgi:hypothetical protein